MAGPVLARNQGGRRYVWPPEPPYELVVPSVTTITGRLDKPALPPSAAKITAGYAVDNLLEWEALPTTEAVEMIKGHYRKEWSRKASFGTAVHKHVAATLLNDEIDDVHPDELPYIAAAMQFVEDHVEKIGTVEQTFFNATFQYAGTPDLFALLKDGRYAIVDWKSGASGIWPETALQLTAYARAEFIGRDDGTRINLDKPITAGVGVHLKDDGTYEAFFCEITDRLFGIFRALRNLQVWKDDMESDVWSQRIKGKQPEKETA